MKTARSQDHIQDEKHRLQVTKLNNAMNLRKKLDIVGGEKVRAKRGLQNSKEALCHLVFLLRTPRWTRPPLAVASAASGEEFSWCDFDLESLWLTFVFFFYFVSCFYSSKDVVKKNVLTLLVHSGCCTDVLNFVQTGIFF